MDLKKTSIT